VRLKNHTLFADRQTESSPPSLVVVTFVTEDTLMFGGTPWLLLGAATEADPHVPLWDRPPADTPFARAADENEAVGDEEEDDEDDEDDDEDLDDDLDEDLDDEDFDDDDFDDEEFDDLDDEEFDDDDLDEEFDDDDEDEDDEDDDEDEGDGETF
jgi:DNA-directed RNA polymerase subunit delta